MMKINKNIIFNYELHEAVHYGPQFSFLDKEGNIRNKPIRCKDYYQDTYWAELLSKGKIIQYGYIWDGNTLNPVSKQNRVLVAMMSDSNDNLWKKKKNLINLLNPIEKILKIPKTTIIRSNNDTDIICSYSNKWSKLPCLLSLYFLLLRLGIYYKGKNNIEEILDWLNTKAVNEVCVVDKQMLLAIIANNKFNKLLKDKVTITQKWEDYEDSWKVHNFSGIVSYKF